MKRTSLISIRLENEMLDKLEAKNEHGDISKAIRYYIELGLLVENYKSAIKEPQFLKSIEELKQGDRLFEWLATLKDNELDSIFMAAKMEKEGRYAQAKLR